MCIYVCVYMYVYICMCIYVCVYMYVYICMCVIVYLNVSFKYSAFHVHRVKTLMRLVTRVSLLSRHVEPH